jgi:hypothetical protein
LFYVIAFTTSLRGTKQPHYSAICYLRSATCVLQPPQSHCEERSNLTIICYFLLSASHNPHPQYCHPEERGISQATPQSNSNQQHQNKSVKNLFNPFNLWSIISTIHIPTILSSCKDPRKQLYNVNHTIFVILTKEDPNEVNGALANHTSNSTIQLTLQLPLSRRDARRVGWLTTFSTGKPNCHHPL